MTPTATRGEPVDPEVRSALRIQVSSARAAAPALAIAGSDRKNAVLAQVAELLQERNTTIVEANGKDLVTAREAGRSESFLDRLELTPERITALAESLSDVIALPDPIGEVMNESLQPSGLRVGRVRVPLGLIASIYESRPNVTIDIAALCLKSGNACVLRGGREAVNSNTLLAAIVTDALTANGLPGEAVQLIRNPDRTLVAELLRLNDLIDLIVPRGGKPLIERVRDEAHRFAITTHRAKRAREITASPLDEIEGVCAKRKKALLLHFGSARNVARAGRADLEAVGGISKAIAEKIYGHFHIDQ